MDRLLREFSDQLAPGHVVGCVARCTRLASRSETSFARLPSVVEQLARARLEESVVRADAPPAPRDPLVADLRTLDRTMSAS
jgi:hypothetical protein